MLDQIDLSLATQYGCQKSGKTACSRFELAGLQIATSIVTLNPPKELAGELKPSKSAIDWYPKTDGILGRVEFQAVAPKLKVPQQDQILKLFYWDNIFAQALVVKAIGDARQGKMDWFQNKFFQTDLAVFESYMNQVIIESAFGGLTITAPVSDLLYGYESFILTQAKNTNPLLGGDPSVQNVVGLSEKITDVVQSRNTGSKDLSQADQFQTINGLGYINIGQPYFDGKDVITVNTNPWKAKVALLGSDNIYPQFLTESSSPVAYITDVCRFGTTEFVKSVVPSPEGYPGFKANRYRIQSQVLASSKKVPGNSVYSQDVIDGAMNMTAVQQAPVFLTKLNMEGVDPAFTAKVQIQTSAGATPTFNADTDDLYLDIEPTTGVPTKINFELLTSVGFEYDTLFNAMPNVKQDSPILIPIMQLRRNMDNLSDAQIKSIFGDLIAARKFKVILKIGLGVLSLGLLALAIQVSLKNKDIQDEAGDRENLEDAEGSDMYVSGKILDGKDKEGQGEFETLNQRGDQPFTTIGSNFTEAEEEKNRDNVDGL